MTKWAVIVDSKGEEVIHEVEADSFYIAGTDNVTFVKQGMHDQPAQSYAYFGRVLRVRPLEEWS